MESAPRFPHASRTGEVHLALEMWLPVCVFLAVFSNRTSPFG